MIGTENLPDELVKELALKSRGSEIKMRIKECMKPGKHYDKNDLLVALWNEYKEVYKRTNLSTAVNAMLKAGDLVRVEKGYYALAETDTDELESEEEEEFETEEAATASVSSSIEPNACEYCTRPIEGLSIHHDGKTFCSRKCIKEYEDELE